MTGVLTTSNFHEEVLSVFKDYRRLYNSRNPKFSSSSISVTFLNYPCQTLQTDPYRVMKLDEAAAILGVHPDSPIETLKQTYRRLALAWHPDKCSNPNAKEKFQQISIAYTKLISAQSVGGKRLEDEESDEDNASKRGDESNEMAAFMRMFMDLVGIFNEDQSLSEDGKIPAAGVSFGMMFGSRTGTAEEWSTEDEAEVDELEEEEEEEEVVEDEEFYDSDLEPEGAVWEPPAKQYSQMNLKEEVGKERQSKLTEETEQDAEIAEARRKLKNAKKRVEKRRKQKDKKLREAVLKEEEEEQLRQIEETKKREEEEAAAKHEEDLRLLRQAKIAQRVDLLQVIRTGDCSKVKAFIGDTLEHVKSSRAAPLPPAVVQRASVMLELVNTQPLLHCCVSEPSSRLDGKDPGQGRLEVANYLLGLKNRIINLNVTDDDGRTALHLAAKKEDSAILAVFLAAREESSERRAQLDINSRCGKSGWTILHYAAGQGDVTAVRMLMNAGAALVVHSTVGKAVTPLDLVKTRLQNAGHFSAAHIANLQQVAKEISEGVRALEKVKHQKEAERLLKEEKLEAARKKQAEREEIERELLERKQKQLKVKQERDRNRDVDVKTVSGTTTQSSSLSSTSRSMSHNSNVTGGLTPQSLLSATTSPSPSFTPPSSSNTSVCNASIDLAETVDGLKSAKKKKKRDKKTESEVVITPSTQESEKVTVVDVASRDELLNHLLAMGFAEVDCFSAISLFGRDLDRALSWLCDRPAQSSENDTTSVKSITSSTHTHTAPGSTVSGSAVDSVTQLAETNRLQKEKDHKEELRRVNRAWNIKAEDEKKKAETEKRQKEDARQSDLLQLQQRQQQQQQQLQLHLLQQQHLQQLLAQQQQLLHRPQNASNYSFNNPIMNQGSNGQNSNTHNNSNGNINGNKMNMSATNPSNPSNLTNLNTLSTGSNSSTNTHVMIDPQRDLRSRENLGLGPHSLSNPSPGTPMQSPNQRIDKQNTRIERILGHNSQSGLLSPTTNALSHTPSSSSNFGHNHSVLQNMNSASYSTADHSVSATPHSQQISLSSGLRDEMLGGVGRGSGFRGQPGPPPAPSYDMSAYNELRAQALRMRGPQGITHMNLGSNGSSGISMAPPAPSPFSKSSVGQMPSQGARGGSNGLGFGVGVGERGSLLSQQYDTREYSGQTGPPQLRPAPPSYPQNAPQHFLTPNPSPTNSQAQLRPQNMAFAPLGFDDTGRPRNSHSLPAGQSQQVFQSQQQLQEQESSRLHHQSQQYAFNGYSSEDDDFSDPSLELSVKAKPFIPQYMSPSTKSSNSPIAIPVLHSHLGMGSSSRSQGYLNMTGGNMNNSNSINGHTLSSNSLSIPGGMMDTWGSIGPSRSSNLSNVSLNSMGAGSAQTLGSAQGLGSAPLGMEMQLNQAHLLSQSRVGQVQNQGQGQVFDKHLGSSGGSGFNLSVMSSLSNNSSPNPNPNLQMARSMPPSPQFSQYSYQGSHSSDRTSQGSSSINTSYSSTPGSSRGRGITSLDLLGVEQDRPYSEVMPSLLSGLLTSNSNSSAVSGNTSLGTRDNYSISDRYSVSLDSDDNMRGLESRDQGLLSRLRQGKDQDPFGTASLPHPGGRSFGGPGQGYEKDTTRGFHLNLNLNRG